jgi:hypothetical protein
MNLAWAGTATEILSQLPTPYFYIVYTYWNVYHDIIFNRHVSFTYTRPIGCLPKMEANCQLATRLFRRQVGIHRRSLPFYRIFNTCEPKKLARNPSNDTTNTAWMKESSKKNRFSNLPIDTRTIFLYSSPTNQCGKLFFPCRHDCRLPLYIWIPIDVPFRFQDSFWVRSIYCCLATFTFIKQDNIQSEL